MKRLTLTIRTISAFAVAMLLAGSSVAAPVMLTQESIHEDFFFLGDFHTYDYASSVDFYSQSPDGILGGYWIGNGGDLNNSMTWGHTLPDGLNVPPDVVDRARLWIDAAWVDGSGNEVSIQGTMDWDPLNNRFLDNTTYDLANVEAPNFWNDGVLNVTVAAGEFSLRIDQAILMIDWTDMDAGAVAHAPEPATMGLFALGLIGLGIGVRRMRRKENESQQ